MSFKQEVSIIKCFLDRSFRKVTHSVSSLENGLEGYKPVRKETTAVIPEKDASS